MSLFELISVNLDVISALPDSKRAAATRALGALFRRAHDSEDAERALVALARELRCEVADDLHARDARRRDVRSRFLDESDDRTGNDSGHESDRLNQRLEQLLKEVIEGCR